MRRDFHQVNIQFFRFTESISEFYDTERFVLDPDQTHFRRSDFTVDAVRRLISSDVTFPLKIKKRAALPGRLLERAQVFLQTLNEGFDRHHAKIDAATGTHGYRLRITLLVPTTRR